MPTHAPFDFDAARFGMFIHWGPYAAAGRGEWVMNRERIPPDEYTERYVNAFTADDYDPAAWVQLAVDAGMKYVVLTTRHHDGFALWPTQQRDFHAGRLGPKRDLVGPFVEAARAAGLGVGLYYSVADWTHPDYPDAFARDWPTAWHDEAARQRFVAYYRAQLHELLTGFGRIDILWYDGCIPQPTDGKEVNAFVRSLQPHILINSRNGKQREDFVNSEQAINPAEPGVRWEACMTLNGNWGYHRGDERWKDAREVVSMLTETAKNSGNLLLNVGPDARGRIPQPSVDILRAVGTWLQQQDEWLARSDRSPFGWVNFGNVTVKGSTVYLHILARPGDELCYAELANRVHRVRHLATGRALPFTQDGPRLHIRQLPPVTDAIGYTLALDVEGTPSPHTTQSTHWIPGQ